MLRRLRAFLVLSVVSIPALAAAQEPAEEAAEEATDTPTSDAHPAAQPSTTAAPVTSTAVDTTPVPPPPTTESEAKRALEGWQTEVHGYFRAPMALGISSRPNPDQVGQLDASGNKIPDGPSHLQISYAPNRVMDWSYYSFAYTRLQEQDWAEATFHIKKKHVDAAVGWMGYWLAATGLRDPDAAMVPGVASLTLDTDFDLAGIKPNLSIQMGAWWPGYGYFEKYDTFTLGRFRQMGEEVKLTVPLDPDLTATLVQGFGTGRDGSFKYGGQQDPLYAVKAGANLIAWGNLQIAYKKYVDIGLHYNYEFTRDPKLTEDAGATDGKAYTQAADAHLSVVGGVANLRTPWRFLGRLWVSPSYISVKNGWALSGYGGTEVMHAQSGLGLATNYLQWAGSTGNSTGSGTIFNLGFLYELTLSDILDRAPGSLPEIRFNAFGLMANASLDLPGGSKITLTSIKQLKYGGDLTFLLLNWFAVMFRGDTVNYDMDHAGFIFSAITSRLTIFSHFLSGESIYLQYSRYIYGSNMVLAGNWPADKGGSGWPLVAGTNVVQGGTYFGQKPDENVIKLQAQIAF
jgi:hypothetical protein